MYLSCPIFLKNFRTCTEVVRFFSLKKYNLECKAETSFTNSSLSCNLDPNLATSSAYKLQVITEIMSKTLKFLPNTEFF